MRINRRGFISATGGAALAFSVPNVIGKAKPTVVVIGGGAGGATAARYVAKDSKGAINVVLIEPTRTYYTCFFSNLYLGGFQKMDDLGHDYGNLAAAGVNVVHDWATGVDRDKKVVATAGGHNIAYDKLIIAPGIDFVDDAVKGWDVTAQNKMPHAYKGGSQTELLRSQIMNMREGGTFVMVAPPNPYRCPPGPYERVSMIAHQFKKTNPKAKIIILDPKPKFSKQALFQEGWSNHYKGMIEWLNNDITGGVKMVNPDTMEVVTDGETFKADVCNVIPAMKAGRIAQIAGVTNDKGWAPVNGTNMQSTMDENVYVLGDAAQQGAMPKSGFSANSQAKVCANAVRGVLTGSKVFPAKYANTCWSLIDTNDGVKVGAAYEGTADEIKSVSTFISKTGESAELRKKTYEESLGWYAGITKDMCG
ncbi:MAG: NAD(P)/FAD-dependent oxidoreductase [Burkholderiaceae bacterium]